MSCIYIDPAPCNEECVQAGTDEYEPRARAEARIYVKQLKRLFPLPEALEGQVKYRLVMNPHDSSAGQYLDIQLHFWNSSDATDYACNVEDNLPEAWDEAARLEVETLKLQWEGVLASKHAVEQTAS